MFASYIEALSELYIEALVCTGTWALDSTLLGSLPSDLGTEHSRLNAARTAELAPRLAPIGEGSRPLEPCKLQMKCLQDKGQWQLELGDS